ncbi:MAG TPA: MMPL family transporter [Micromonosporaceae bacterium]|nr:MMPL family transporter [Micromonosporaceae bacterium]
MERFLDSLGRATAAHPWRTLAAWLLAAVAVIGLGQLAGGDFVNDFRVPGAESQRAADLARDHFPGYGAASATVVWHTDSGSLRDPAAAAAIRGMVAGLRRQPGVTSVDDPLAEGLSPDGRTARADVRYGKEVGELTSVAYERLDAAAGPARAAGMDVDFSGEVVEIAFQPETGPTELIGLAAALLVLLVAFGSVVAAGLPIAVAVAGLLVGTAGVLLAGAASDIPTAAPVVAVMLGIGAGVDYALFVVTRFRHNLADGQAPVAAAGGAVATSGHAVLYAGGTVVLAILGLTFTGVPFIGGMGIASAIVVAVMVVAALTLLPALLGLLGHRVNALRVGRRGAATRRAAGPGGWDRWARHLGAHKVTYAVAATALLLLLAAPLLFLRLGTPDDGNSPRSWPQRRAYDAVAAGFGPGWNAPLLVAVELPDGGAEPAVRRLRDALAADPEVSLATPPVTSPDGRVALITAIPRHAPQDEAVTDLAHRIRDSVAPSALAGSGARAHLGGRTAFFIDVAGTVAQRLPWVVLGVIVGAALLLLAMFRAPLVALKAAVMTMLSIGAAYGVIVAVFQWGWGLSLIGVDKPVPIMSIVPMLLFAVLFGLSMDYEVFLLSSIREEYDRTGDPSAAVTSGLARTGRVITAAATIMAVVFVTFALIDDTLVKMIGIGLAAAVIVDATVIRVVLAPAVMMLLGHRAWWPARARTPTEPSVDLAVARVN